MSKRLTRDALVERVASSLPLRFMDDLPAIRQALNDTADSYRKDGYTVGYTVGDYAQGRMVRDVQVEMERREQGEAWQEYRTH